MLPLPNVNVVFVPVALFRIVPPLPLNVPTLGAKLCRSSVPPFTASEPLLTPRALLLPSWRVPTLRVVPPR